MARTEVAIIGAGPAGLAAALRLADAGVDITVVDEQPQAGGQIYRQPPVTFKTRPAARPGQHLLEAASKAKGVRWRHETTVWGLFPAAGVSAVSPRHSTAPGQVQELAAMLDAATVLEQTPAAGVTSRDGLRLGLSGPNGVELLEAKQVLLATGAFDLPVAFPGWTLPGVMAAGGIQAFVKSQHMLPGRRFVLAGAHPLLLIIADQLLQAGADLAAVIFAQPRLDWQVVARAIPVVWRLAGKALEPLKILRRLRRHGVTVKFGQIIVRAEGDGAVERAILCDVDESWHPLPGTEQAIACDTIGLGYGFVPANELARQAGCETRWQAEAGGWLITHDNWMRSSRPGLYVAGEVTGVGGAELAEVEGNLAAIGMLQDSGRYDAAAAAAAAAPLRKQYHQLTQFATVLHQLFAPQPSGLARLLRDETIVCRCEEVTAGTLRAQLAANAPLETADAVKLLTRTGMGLCQGRMCWQHVALLVQELTGQDLESIGPYRASIPVKPIPAGGLVRLWEALVRGQTD